MNSDTYRDAFLKFRAEGITLTKAQFKQWEEALDAPAKVIPGLKKLFSQPSVFEKANPLSTNQAFNAMRKEQK